MVEYPKYLTLDEVETFEASPLDVVVCAFPKTGNVTVTNEQYHSSSTLIFSQIPYQPC